MQSFGSSSYGVDMADRGPALLNNIRGLLNGTALTFEGYESDDDPNSIVGKRVTLKWKSERCVAWELRSFV